MSTQMSQLSAERSKWGRKAHLPVISLAVGLLLGLAAPLHSQPSARVTGRIVNEGGSSVAGARVILQPQGGTNTPQRTVQSAADGGFDFRSVPAGRFTICAESSDGAYLNPCIWSPFETAIDVSSTGVVNKTVLVRAAARVRVTFSDPSTFALAGGGGSPADFGLGVWTSKGMYYSLVQVAGDTRNRTLELSVPFDEDLVLGGRGKYLRLSVDSVSVDTKQGGRVPFRIPKGTAAPKSFSVAVLGLSN